MFSVHLHERKAIGVVVYNLWITEVYVILKFGVKNVDVFVMFPLYLSSRKSDPSVKMTSPYSFRARESSSATDDDMTYDRKIK